MRKVDTTLRDPSRPSRHAHQEEGSRLFFTAVLLARKGRYTEAASLLQKVREAGGCSAAEAWDLQARIYAQQGQCLEAESCWRKAQSLESANPAYAKALQRLREARQPRPRVYGPALLVVALVLLGLLLWQMGFANPASRGRWAATDRSLGALRSELTRWRDAGAAQDQDAATALAGITEELRASNTRLWTRLEGMPTLAGMNAGQEAILKLLNDRLNTLEREALEQLGTAAQERSALGRRIAALQETTSQRLADLGQRQVAATTASWEQLKAVQATMEPLQERLSGVESALGKRVDTAESGLRQEIKPLASAAEVRHLARSVSELQKELGQLAAALQEGKPSRRGEDGKGGSAPGDARGQDTPRDNPSPPKEGTGGGSE